MQFEGRLEKPVTTLSIFSVGVVFTLVALGFAYKAYSLQVTQGSAFANISRNNTIERSVNFATRGVIYDRLRREHLNAVGLRD